MHPLPPTLQCPWASCHCVAPLQRDSQTQVCVFCILLPPVFQRKDESVLIGTMPGSESNSTCSHSKASWNTSMAEWTSGLFTVTQSQLMHKPIRNQLKVFFQGSHILLLVVVCWTEAAFPHAGISCISTAQECVYFVVLEISELRGFHILYAPWNKDLVSTEALQKGWASADLFAFWKLMPSKIGGEPAWDHFTEDWGITDTASM